MGRDEDRKKIWPGHRSWAKGDSDAKNIIRVYSVFSLPSFCSLPKQSTTTYISDKIDGLGNNDDREHSGAGADDRLTILPCINICQRILQNCNLCIWKKEA